MTEQKATTGGTKTSLSKSKMREVQWRIDLALNRARPMLDVLVRIESAIMDEFKGEADIFHHLGWLSYRKFDEAVHVAYLKAVDEARERWANDTTVEDVEDAMIAENESLLVKKA